MVRKKGRKKINRLMQIKELVKQNNILKKVMLEILDLVGSTPDFRLSYEVCDLLGHPKPKDGLFCYCGSSIHAVSGQVVNRIYGPIVVECGKSPDGKHCWHNVAPTTIYYMQGRTNKGTDQCCYCGETREYEMQDTYTQTFDNSKHGPFLAKYTMW